MPSVAASQALECAIASAGAIGVVVDVVGDVGMRVLMGDSGADARDTGVLQKVMTDLHGRRTVTQSDAGRPYDAHALSELALQLTEQALARRRGRTSGCRTPAP